MKSTFTICLLLFSLVTWGQGDFSFLKKELEGFGKGDTVAVFGTFRTSFGASRGTYYLATASQSKLIAFYYEEGRYKKVFDSSFNCSDCNIVTNFVQQNFKGLAGQFDSSLQILANKYKVDGISYVTTFSHNGPSYFLGMHTPAKWSYCFVEKEKNINHFFVEGNYLWTYFNLLHTQWPDINP